MKSALLIAALALSASAADLTGTWKAVFLDDVQLKTLSNIVFDLKLDGNRVTGMAHMGSWPADAPISEGKIEGDRISFTCVSDRAWKSGSGGSFQNSAFPKLDFTGTVRGNEIQLKLIWGDVVIYGEAPKPREYRMRAAKVEK